MSSAVSPLRTALSGLDDPLLMLEACAHAVCDALLCDRVVLIDTRSGNELTISVMRGRAKGEGSRGLFSIAGAALAFEGERYRMPVVIGDQSRSRHDSKLQEAMEQAGVRSLGVVPLYCGDAIVGCIECQFLHLYHRWRSHDLSLLSHLGDVLSLALERAASRVAAKDAVPQPVRTASTLQAKTTLRESDDRELQQRRMSALMELSRSLQIELDPALLALIGLKALARGTESDSGVVSFLDRESGKLEIVASEGFSEKYIHALSHVINQHSLHREVLLDRNAKVFKDIQKDERAAAELAKGEGLRSALYMPLMFKDQVLGVLALFRRSSREFEAAECELVQAAASQICMVARQAEFYSAEKRNVQSISALYRLSHELSKHFSATDVAEHVFPIIQGEVPCRRMWLGTLNEAGTHIVGQAGFGPGMRRRIIHVQIELNLRHDFLDEAIRTKAAVVVPGNLKGECSGLNMIMRRLAPRSLVLLPLVALGQVVGLLVIEPENDSPQVTQNQLPLLGSMASEIATVLLARRFESRMADSDKMRMAGLIASGVAHNFNNLLQAVMGQASLIEMQLPKDSALVKSARMIIDSATRGASLISQLLACTVQEAGARTKIKLDTMLQESRDFYRSILGSAIKFELRAVDGLPEVVADYGRLQQIISNLLVNAKEAIGARQDGLVGLSAERVRLKSGEVDPEIAPGEYACITVKDNGGGMDPETLSRCFEPFYSTKVTETPSGAVTGSGLGLSSAYTLLKQYGGLITVRSQQGKGTEFSTYLPAAAEKIGLDDVDRLQPAGPAPDVLIVDLDDSLARSVKSMVNSLRCEVASARKRHRAIEILRHHRGRVRLMVIDVDRMGEDSTGFIRTLSKEFPDLILVVCTFDARRWSRVFEAVRNIELVQKPLSVWALDGLMKTLLKGKMTASIDRAVEQQQEAQKSEEKKPQGNQSKEQPWIK